MSTSTSPGTFGFGLGIDLDDLGLTAQDVGSTAVTSAAPVVPTRFDPDALVPGSPLAQTLYEVWTGRSVVVVNSPPGAGKSTLVCQALTQLYLRSDLVIVLATPTRRGALELAGLLASLLGDAPNGDHRVVIGMQLKAGEVAPTGVATKQTTQTIKRPLIVRTIASCASSVPKCDLMVVDEAYQAVFAQVALAAQDSTQVLLVGDPGQIGPVIQSDTLAWATMSAAPHMRAPEVFEQDEDAVVLRLPCTYRVGPVTAEAIAPLYDFEFSSARPERYLVDKTGAALPEIHTVQVPVPDGEFDLNLLQRVAAQAAGFVGMDVVEVTPEGLATRTLDATDVAVVVARGAQAQVLTAMLSQRVDTADITVGTADRMQGGQWHAVVAVDPLTGTDQVDDFRTGPGRLCVMASRAMSHLTWVQDGRWEDLLAGEAADQDAARKGLAVRRALCENVAR